MKFKNKNPKNMKIDQLPVEILRKIFSYLPKYDQISLVNRQFYNVACKVNDSNVCLTLSFSERKSNLHLLESIRGTNRKITITETQIIKKFSAFIKYLKLEAKSLEMFRFLEILTLVPNADQLVFDFMNISRINQPFQKKRRILRSSDDLNLHQLKTLKLDDCNEEFLLAFNRLPAGVLTELELITPNLDPLTDLFKRQTNIKKLTLHIGDPLDTIPADIFDNLKLESLTWRQDEYTSIKTILSKQNKLKFLLLNNEIINEDVMNAVANQLTELETLTMDVSNISVKAFVNISKLKKLKNLTLLSENKRNSSKFESFAKLNNTAITSLDIRCFKEISVNIICAFAKSAPNLKILRFNFCIDYGIFNAIRRNFNFVEVFTIYNDLPIREYDTNHFIQDECVNPKLIEFDMQYTLPYETPFLSKLITDYPNLEILTIRSSTPLTASHLKLILTGFTKLKSLEFFGASQLTLNDLYNLKDYKKNLEFISFWDLKFKLKPWQKRKLGTIFDVVNVDSDGFLTMSVDAIKVEEQEKWPIHTSRRTHSMITSISRRRIKMQCRS